MKKILIGISFFCFHLTMQSQDYLVAFAATGDTNKVATVRVDNLTSGASVILAGDDTLHLVEAVGIPAGEIRDDRLRLYPNPVLKESLLTFTAPETGYTTIRILDLTGKTIMLYHDRLPAGTWSFMISGIRQGIYVVNVSGSMYSYHAKLISRCAAPQEPVITPISSVGSSTSSHQKNASATVDMPYHDGDQLLFRGISGNYSNVVPDVPASGKTILFNFTACTDAGNNHYPTVQIGSQTWMAGNLNVGIRIDGNQDQTNNGIIEKYCYLDDDLACAQHGGLYQWDELMQYSTGPGGQGICPAGWHVPTDAEWCTLTQYLDPTVDCSAFGWSGLNAGGKLKETGTLEAGTGSWHQPNTGATNETGFSGLPSGNLSENGIFAYQGYYGYWWSSTELNTVKAWSRSPDYSVASIVRGGNMKICGFSVRCIHD